MREQTKKAPHRVKLCTSKLDLFIFILCHTRDVAHLVVQAPEAGNILWENLELTKRERGRRKTLTLWITIVLLGLSFAVLYASNTAEREFNSAGESQAGRGNVGRR